jgi:hypothetical protein
MEDFYDRLPVLEGFAGVVDPERYAPLPGDAWIGMTDVVGSTEAIAQGRYKAVNTGGAAAIAAVGNALGHRRFPFVFGGDGASFAVSGADAGRARAALAATAAWSRDDLGLGLRAAMIPVADARAAGVEVSAARFAPSANVSYAMFSGGGLTWAERAMKAGRYAIPAAPAGTRPDLSGLSCRWSDIPAERGLILSLLVAPSSTDAAAFRRLVQELLRDIDASGEAGRPIPEGGPGVRWPSPGLELETLASRRGGETPAAARRRLRLHTWLAWVIFKTGLRVGQFDPARYRRELVENSDFRKYDDHLRMTLDCTPALADRLERRLAKARDEGVAEYGMHRQQAALMTCIVPAATQSDHLHFVDGAAGGYALAARAMKAAGRVPA